MGKRIYNRITKDAKMVEVTEEEIKKEFKKELKALLERYKSYIGHKYSDRILIHLGENDGIKGGEITKYF